MIGSSSSMATMRTGTPCSSYEFASAGMVSSDLLTCSARPARTREQNLCCEAVGGMDAAAFAR